MVEIVVVLAIMAVAMSMFAQTIASSVRLNPMASETAAAAEGARTQFEKMHNQAFAKVFALYNDDRADDPDGAGTAPGSHFAVERLSPVEANGWVGTILFPTKGAGLREDVVDDELGLPRDLNGDGIVDNLDHAGDCIILPVEIRIEWASRSGKNGKRSLTLHTMLSSL